MFIKNIANRMHVHMYAHIATHLHVGLDIFDCQTLDT